MDTWLAGAEDRLRAQQRRAGGDLSSLAEEERETAAFSGDVAAHQAELRFLNMQAQRYIDQAKVWGQGSDRGCHLPAIELILHEGNLVFDSYIDQAK
jgi:hypothetical protein